MGCNGVCGRQEGVEVAKQTMNYVSVIYRGAKLTIPEWLAPLWPYDLPLHRFPSFCGAGDGFGDAVVPEDIFGVCISPACFIHDVDWACSPDTIREFLAANFRLAKNIRALVLASALPWWKKEIAVARAYGLWFTAVSTVGALCFDPMGESFESPLDNPEIQKKLRRLATARIDCQRDMVI